MPYIPTQAEQDAVLPPPAPLPQSPLPQAPPLAARAAPATSSGPYIPTQPEQNAAVPPSVASAGRSLLGTDGGKLGCASTACRVLTAAGIPFPMTPSAAGMEQQMAAHGFVRSDPMQSDVLFGQGTGPSGRHVMVNAGGGRTIEDPGGSRGNAVQYGRIPTGDPTLTGWKYVGAQGQGQANPAPAQAQSSGGYVPTAQEAADNAPAPRPYAQTLAHLQNSLRAYNAKIAGPGISDQDVQAMQHTVNQSLPLLVSGGYFRDDPKMVAWAKSLPGQGGMTGVQVPAAFGVNTPGAVALSHGQGASPAAQPLNALQQMLGLGNTHGTIYTSGKATLQGLAQTAAQGLALIQADEAAKQSSFNDARGQIGLSGYNPSLPTENQAQAQANAQRYDMLQGAITPVVGPQSLLGHGVAAAQQGPQAFGKFAHGVPHGIAQETIQNPVGQALNVLPFLTDGLLRGVRGVTGDIAAGRELAQPTGAGSRPALALAARTAQGAAVVTPHPTAPGVNGAARAVDGTFVKPEDVAPPVQAAPVQAAPASARYMSVNKLAESIDRNSPGVSLNVQAIKTHLGNYGQTYQLTDVDPRTLKIQDADTLKPGLANMSKGPIVVDGDNNIVDGRHRAAAAIANGHPTIPAYVPAVPAMPEPIAPVQAAPVHPVVAALSSAEDAARARLQAHAQPQPQAQAQGPLQGPPEAIPAPGVRSAPGLPAPGVRSLPGGVPAPAVRSLTLPAPGVRSLPLDRLPAALPFTPPKGLPKPAEAAPVSDFWDWHARANEQLNSIRTSPPADIQSARSTLNTLHNLEAQAGVHANRSLPLDAARAADTLRSELNWQSSQLTRQMPSLTAKASTAATAASSAQKASAETTRRLEASKVEPGVSHYLFATNKAGEKAPVAGPYESQLKAEADANRVTDTLSTQFPYQSDGLTYGKVSDAGAKATLNARIKNLGSLPAEAAPAAPTLAGKLDATAAAAAARLKARSTGRLSSGIDPQDLADFAIIGASKIAKGTIQFGQWSAEMVQEFGDAIRPHLAAVYQAAHDHVQSVLSQYPNEPHPNAAAIDAARPGAAPAEAAPAEAAPAEAAPAEAAPAEAAPVAAPARTKPVMAGSVNLGNLDTTPEAKAALAAHTTALPSLSDADARTQAKAMNLTTAHLKAITPGEVPTGVPSKVFGSAVRQLAVAKAEQAASADAAHQAAPTAQTLAAATQANLDLKTVVTHQEALAQAAGQSLQGHGMQASAFEGALAKAADHQQALAQTPKLADLSAPVAKSPRVQSPRVTSPKAKGFGAGNTVFTTEARDAALARIAAAGRQVNSGIDPALFKDAVIVAGHYIEGGIRQYAPLAAQMRTHFPNATDGDLQRVYSTAKAEAAAGVTAKQRTTGTTVLADRLAPRMGKQGVSDFINALPPVHLDKLLSGAPFTDAEARTVAQIYQSHLPPSKSASPPMAAIKVLRNAVRDAKAGRLGYDSAKAAVREELLKAVDEKKVPAVTQALAGVKDDDFHALANVYNRHYPVDLVEKIKTVQQASLLSGPKTLGGIAAAHTIGAGFEDLAVRPLAAALSGGTVQGLNLKATGAAVKAGVHALPEGAQMIKHGPTALQLQGIHGGMRMEETGSSHLHGEPIQSPLVRLPGRVHSALYHVVGQALKERGLQEFSALKARKLGGSPAQYRGDADVKQSAGQYASEQLYQNPNKASDMVNAAAQRGGPPGRFIVNTLMPFRNVPMNLAGRGAEYSGLGAPLAGVRALNMKMTGKDLMSGKVVEPADLPAFRRGLAMQAARGIAGPAAGLGVGMGLSAAGVLNAPNQKAYESGSLNIGRNKYDIGRLQPVSTPLLEGGELYNALHGRPASAAAPFMDNPYSQTAQQFSDVSSGLSGDKSGKAKLTRAVGSLVGELSPTLLSQIASATDPSGSVRKKQSALHYLMNRVPGLRERLPVGVHPQASNYKSTGPLSLLYPGNVEPRTGRR